MRSRPCGDTRLGPRRVGDTARRPLDRRAAPGLRYTSFRLRALDDDLLREESLILRQLSITRPTGKVGNGETSRCGHRRRVPDQAGCNDRQDTAQRLVGGVRGACADAGLSVGDIDGLISDGPEGVGLRDRMPAPGLAEQLGQPLRFHARSAVGAGSTAAGLNLAAYAIAHGLAEVVVIANAVAGHGAGYASANRDEAVAAMAKLSGPYEYVYGTTRVSDYATHGDAPHVRLRHDLGAAGRDRRRAAARRHPAPAVGARPPRRAHGRRRGRPPG